MRILMTTDAVGGVWSYALELARGLARQRVEIDLAVLGPSPSRDQRAEAARVPGLRLHDSGGLKLEWMQNPWRDVTASGDWLLKLEQAVRPDVVHLNGYSHGALAWRSPVLVVGHSCVLSWWRAVHRTAAPDRWETYRRKVTAGLRAADLVVAPTRTMLMALLRSYGPFRQCHVIPNARSLDRRFRGAATRRNYVLSAGRLWDPAKNLAVLRKAASGLAWPIFVAGDARHPEGEEVPVGKLRLLGRLEPETLHGFMQHAGIYALPALYEPFGLSVLEAALVGCPLVLGDIPSLRESWEGVARFVPPQDPGALRRALAELIADPAERGRLGHEARQRAARFCPECMTQSYLDAYRILGVSFGSQGRPALAPQPAAALGA